MIEEVRELPPLERFLYWVRERDQILKRRQAGLPKPWTEDTILQNYSFTNVRREDDKVTRWCTEHITEPLGNDPIVVFAICAFRWFNLPDPSGEYMLSHGYLTDWNTKKVIAGLNEFRSRGLKIFTGAFNISNSGMVKPKLEGVCEDYIEPLWLDRNKIYLRIKNGKTLANAAKVLGEYKGFGGSGFMAAQAICDLAYTHVLKGATDWHTWCSWGPGSKRGMNRVCSLPEDHRMPRAEWDRNLARLRQLIRTKVGIDLHARNVQNCLCEFSKYERALLKQGSIKRRYAGT